MPGSVSAQVPETFGLTGETLVADAVGTDDAQSRVGKYATWRSNDPTHQTLMAQLAAQSDPDEYSRLWLSVIDQALVDAFTPRPRTESFWADSAHFWLKSPGFDDACSSAGLNPAWARRVIRASRGAQLDAA